MPVLSASLSLLVALPCIAAGPLLTIAADRGSARLTGNLTYKFSPDVMQNNNFDVSASSWKYEYDNVIAGGATYVDHVNAFTPLKTLEYDLGNKIYTVTNHERMRLTAFTGGVILQITGDYYQGGPVPEPSTFVMFGVGLLGLGAVFYQHRKKSG